MVFGRQGGRGLCISYRNEWLSSSDRIPVLTARRTLRHRIMQFTVAARYAPFLRVLFTTKNATFADLLHLL